MPPVLCDYCESPDHNAYTCPFRTYVDAICASFEKKINDMTDQMVETMKKRLTDYYQCFNQNRETYSEINASLGSPTLDISLYDDFEPSYSYKSNSNEHMPLPNLELERDLPTSLSTDLASCTNSLKDVAEDILVYICRPNHHFERLL